MARHAAPERTQIVFQLPAYAAPTAVIPRVETPMPADPLPRPYSTAKQRLRRVWMAGGVALLLVVIAIGLNTQGRAEAPADGTVTTTPQFAPTYAEQLCTALGSGNRQELGHLIVGRKTTTGEAPFVEAVRLVHDTCPMLSPGLQLDAQPGTENGTDSASRQQEWANTHKNG